MAQQPAHAASSDELEERPVPLAVPRLGASGAPVTSAHPHPTPAVASPSRTPASSSAESELSREGLYRSRQTWLDRLGAWARELVRTRAEREEALLRARLERLPLSPARCNVLVTASPKGGSGKTTVAFCAGSLLAATRRLRVAAIDVNPDLGTLGDLVPDACRTDRTVVELIGELERVDSAIDLRQYMAVLSSGLQVIAGPTHAQVRAQITPATYARLLAVMRRYVELVVLDLGTDITGENAQWAFAEADHVLVLATPDYQCANLLGRSLAHLPLDKATLVVNHTDDATGRDEREAAEAIVAHFAARGLQRHITLPYDRALKESLRRGTYQLDDLRRATRIPLRRLAVTIAEQLA